MAGNMLFRDENGVVREIPSDQYVSSKRAYPDLTWKGGGDDLSVGFLNDPAKTKALQLAKSNRIFPSSLFGSNPATAWTDADFARLMELQRPLSAARTQREIDEEQYLKDKLAASTAAMQLKPDSYKSYQGDGKLTPARIAQMYPSTSDVEAQVAAAKRTPEHQQGSQELAAVRAQREAQAARDAALEAAREGTRGDAMSAMRNQRLAGEANLGAYGIGQQANYPSASATGESIQRALEIANAKANNMEFEGSLLRNYNAPQNYDVDTQSFRGLPSAVPPPSSTVDRSGEDVDDLRLAQDITGSTAGGALVKGAMPSPGGAAPSSANIAGSLPLMARAGADDNIMGFRGDAYTPGASPDRTMRLNMPVLFPAQTSAVGTTTAARPATRPMPPTPLAPPADIRPREPTSFMSRIFGGPEYQSTGDRVVKESGQGVNFGSGENAADFFRADRELRKQRPEMFERQAEARGGAPKPVSGGGGKDAALHKALEIIHHLLVRGR